MKIITAVFMMIFLSITTAARADSYSCTGKDKSGNPVNLVYDVDASTIKYDGKTLKVTAYTKGRNGIATEDFKRDDGLAVYVSLVTEGKDQIVVRQMRSKDDQELLNVPLTCE